MREIAPQCDSDYAHSFEVDLIDFLDICFTLSKRVRVSATVFWLNANSARKRSFSLR